MAIQFDREQIKKWTNIDNNYKINDKLQLGKGAYGIVFQGYSLKKDTLIAIKTVRSNTLSIREIQTLRALSSLDHQNIMGFYGDLTIKQNTFLFIEYCNNGTLTDAIHKGISQLQVLKYFREIVEGMCYMNAKGKMHRDLKPDNILIGPENDIKISDFGLAQTTNSIFVTGFRGTPLYAAPEVFFKQNEEISYTNNCDVWSAGLILYEMLAGERLYKNAKDYLQLKQEWLKCERGLDKVTLNSKFHPLWQYFINKMLQFDNKKRPSFHQILTDLKRVYSKMKQTIQTGKNMIQQLQLSQASLYIDYNIAKHQILLDICEKFTKQDLKLKNQYKYVCMFLAIIRYVLFFKDFIKNLRYRRLKLDNGDRDLLMNKNQLPQVQFFCDRNRFTLQHRYQFYSKQLKQNIAKRIIEVYCTRKQSQNIMDNLNESVQIIRNYYRGQFIDSSQQLSQVFKSVGNIVKKTFEHKRNFQQTDLRLYSLLLLAILIENKFPQSLYIDPKTHKQLYQITTNDFIGKLKPQQLLKYIQNMQQQLSK